MMKGRDSKRLLASVLPDVLIVLGVAGLFAYGFFRIVSLQEEVQRLAGELASTNELLAEQTTLLAKGVESLGQKSVELSDTLYAAEQEIEGTQQNVEAVQSRLGGFEQQVGQISGTVNTLEKLSKTDPELLQKYSKVYFLNEHYVPERLTQIPSNYLYSDNSPEHIHTVVWPYLKELLDAAQLANVPVYIRSAYRSFDEQSALKTQYTVLYGAGTANQFSADQGYSEHQLGTTVDFITTGLSGQLTGFENTQAYQWLLANAHKYGFTLSYPSGNPSYIFEPWHWRYVGISLAGYLHDQNKYFYDFEQREIDEYLVNLFD